MRLVRDLVDGGAAGVVITHDAGEWLDAADDVAFLRDGRVVDVAPADVVRRSPALFEAAGLESPLLVRARAAREGGAHA